jgi:hypothetical protein
MGMILGAILAEVANIIFFGILYHINNQYHGQKSDITSCIYHFKKMILYHIISYIILIFTLT